MFRELTSELGQMATALLLVLAAMGSHRGPPNTPSAQLAFPWYLQAAQAKTTPYASRAAAKVLKGMNLPRLFAARRHP